ncbi:FAD:protein FMN transferase [Liquorilactobacillus uvarum]|uniref:FAD:protein FMN transferase n=1 Tax=Liquorilactobacillus uvarum TaxID=303240 RepID=UPI002889C188|nr:FAD:protein FMN transferase [Liquorilactobacillus uvarum]
MKVTANIAQQCVGKSFYALGTTINLTAFGTASEGDLEDTYHLITAYEDKLTVNRTNSEIMAINRAAGKEPIQVSSGTYQLVKKAVEISRKHEGFNVAIGPLVKLWRIGFKEANVPDEQQIEAKRVLTDPKRIILNDMNMSVFLPDSGMELDLGGIAKGYIADRIRSLWDSRGILAGIINLGGNILTIGACPLHEDHKWRIGVQNPWQKRGKPLILEKVGPCSAVTSGVYERYFETTGKKYHHILDSRTGYPLKTDLVSVTVFTKDSIVGEIESTRLFFAGSLPLNWGEKRSDLYGAIFVYRDQSIRRYGFQQ